MNTVEFLNFLRNLKVCHSGFSEAFPSKVPVTHSTYSGGTKKVSFKIDGDTDTVHEFLKKHGGGRFPEVKMSLMCASCIH